MILEKWIAHESYKYDNYLRCIDRSKVNITLYILLDISEYVQ